jgi:Trk K+ transport system NAD-binding subunit
MTERYVRMKPLKELVRKKLISIEHMSDDGEYIRYKILPNGPIVGHWNREGEKLLVVDCQTVHVNELKMAPQLYVEEPDTLV